MKKSSSEAKTSPANKKTRTVATVSPELVQELEAGRCACANLTETLAVDQRKLAVAVGVHVPEWTEGRIVAQMFHVAAHMPDWTCYKDHISDIVRGWACIAMALSQTLSFAEKCHLMKDFAADPHFGVREWAWMALRRELIEKLDEGLALLTPWTQDSDPNVRRFASEATRPRGVWASHIKALRQNPAPGLNILEPLRADPARYVNDSVANWLNDAAKDNPDWVRQVCARWSVESDNPHTARIIQRGLRSLK